MTADLMITRDGELMVAQVEAGTEEGTAFLDAYIPPPGAEFQVVDSGRLLVWEADLAALLAKARGRGLTADGAVA